MNGVTSFSRSRSTGFTLPLQKSRILQILGVKGEAVVSYCEPLTTQEMRYHRLSRKVNNTVSSEFRLDLIDGDFQDKRVRRWRALLSLSSYGFRRVVYATAGFTLVEILLAITILGIIMATVLGIFTGIISSSKTAEKRAELYQTGRAVMDLLVTDIRGLYGQATEEAQVFFVGHGENAPGTGPPRLAFVTTNTLSIGTQKAPFMSEVGYFLEENPDKGGYSLWRRGQTPPQEPYDEGGRAVPVCRIVEKFELEFVHGDDIIKNLDNALPRAIRIGFTLNLDGETERFVTMVRPMITGVMLPDSGGEKTEGTDTGADKAEGRS